MRGRNLVGARRLWPVAVIVLVGLVGSACSSGGGTKASSGGPGTTIAGDGGTTVPGGGTQKAAARWETVSTFSGTGNPAAQPAFDVLGTAIQWRARWTCDSGSLKVETVPPPRRPGALIDAKCPQTGEGFSIVTGPVKLAVTATGPWKVTVDQQVDTPLNEPPLAAMATARVLGKGDFYNVEKNGQGTARLYQLPDGSRALRIENLVVNENTDLFIWLDEAANPKSSKEVVSAQYWVLGNLKSTVGSQNYEIPSNIPIDRVRSVVIWCQPVAVAYAAAALMR